MSTLFITLIKKQEQKIVTLRQHAFLNRKAKCPGCRSRIYMHHTGKASKLCFFCTNCQLMFER